MNETDSARKRCIALAGAFGVDNYGNEATLEAALAGVGAAAERTGVDVTLYCICSDVEGIEERTGLPTLPLHGWGTRGWGSSSRLAPVRMLGMLLRASERLAHAIRDLREVKLLCFAGTGTLDDQHIRPWGLPLDVFLWSIAGRIARTEVVFVSVGAGPISHRASRALYRWATRCAHYLSYRDALSKDYMSGVGRNVDHDVVVPDLVFGLSERMPPVDTTGRPRVALGVLWSGHWPDDRARSAYFGGLCDVVRGLWGAGFDVRLIEGDVHDRDAVAELAGRLAVLEADALGRFDVPFIRTFEDVMTAVAPCAVTVASRYHNLVAALLVGRPTVSLEYGFKNSALMGEFGLDNFCHQIAGFDPARVVEDVCRLRADDGFASRCRSTVSEMRQRVDAQWEQLLLR